MNDLTVIYYTSNREKEGFELNIRQALLDTMGDLPLISVSQKPIDFGENICVGDVGTSEINCRRQVLIGCKRAKTKNICVAESDFVYPVDYFNYVPRRKDRLYLMHPVFVLFTQRKKSKWIARKRNGSEGALISNRKYMIRMLESMLDGFPEWHDKQPGEDRMIPQLLGTAKWKLFNHPHGAITFKTDYQLHRRTPHVPKSLVKEIPYWGNIYTLMEKYR